MLGTTHTRTAAAVLAVTLLGVGCSADDGDGAASGPDEAATADPDTPPTTGPAAIEAQDQSTDGTTVTVASVTLPTDGFVVVHAAGDGGPGAVIGHSDLLAAGTTTDVEVVLDEPLEDDAMVFPMAHVDANGNGVYEFAPPDVVTDVPATTEEGEVAVVGIQLTVG